MKVEELNWWFGKLAELNQTQIEGVGQKERTPKSRFTNRLPLVLVVLPLAIAVSLAVALLLGAPEWIGVVSLSALGLTYLGIFVYPMIALTVHWKSAKAIFRNPFSVLLDNAHSTAYVDRQYLEDLDLHLEDQHPVLLLLQQLLKYNPGQNF